MHESKQRRDIAYSKTSRSNIKWQWSRNILRTFARVNNAPVEGLDITIGANEAKNVFRKDEVKVFEDRQALLQNAPEKEQNMFKIPKVIS